MAIRISKAPEIRRQDLIDKAEQLFAQSGYENTTVSDIVKATSVAQGTFYYYFKSKQDIVNAIIFQHIDRFEADVEKAWHENRGVSATVKLQIMLEEAFITTNLKTLGIMKYMHSEKNLLLHEIFRKELARRACPLLKTIILLGVEEHLFNVKHIEETVNIIFHMISNLFEESLINGKCENSVKLVSKVIGFLLGLPDNMFKLERLKDND